MAAVVMPNSQKELVHFALRGEIFLSDDNNTLCTRMPQPEFHLFRHHQDHSPSPQLLHSCGRAASLNPSESANSPPPPLIKLDLTRVVFEWPVK